MVPIANFSSTMTFTYNYGTPQISRGALRKGALDLCKWLQAEAMAKQPVKKVMVGFSDALNTARCKLRVTAVLRGELMDAHWEQY